MPNNHSINKNTNNNINNHSVNNTTNNNINNHSVNNTTNNNINNHSVNNNSKNLVIYQKYLELIYYSNDIVRKYPKSENFTIVKEIKNSLYAGLRTLMYAIKSYHKQDKLKYLNEFDINLNLLKIHIRLSYKYKYINIQNYQTWSTLVTDICNMLGAWISTCLKR